MSDKPDSSGRSANARVAAGNAAIEGVGRYRPSDFMRARRPELFSDTQKADGPPLTREILEYQLETLTNRKQEGDFEYFCRRLAEKEVCPNLRPQTGPTGGGDSKADSETYPVAGAIAERWFEALDVAANSERWAFAFSAKAKWESKASDDVRKIAQTGRGYKRIYFITSQFAKDKKRANLEDKLSKQYSTPVTILDRQWILDKIFQNKREAVAIEALHLRGFEDASRTRLGPRDSQRQAELELLDKEISDPDRYQGADHQLAEDCLQSALLARMLERPRAEVEGRFDRAQRISEKAKHEGQILHVVYARAWTVFWWYDDHEELNRLYSEVEQLAALSTQAAELELLHNLWQLLLSSTRSGALTREAVKFDERTATLRAALARVAKAKNRPNNALWAKSTSLLIDLSLALQKGDQATVDGVLSQYKRVLADSQRLGGFPLEPLGKLIREFGNLFPESAVYDSLFHKLVGILEKRRSEGEAGRLLITRGLQKLAAGQQYDAIRLLGRAEGDLIKHEYSDDLQAALVGCALAYERAGLLWAARMNILSATTQVLSDFRERGHLSIKALRSALKLVWVEIQLGRVPAVLCWTEVADLMAAHLNLPEEESKAYRDERQTIDAVLGMLILRTDIAEAQKATRLPDVLERQGLPLAALATLYMLGHDDKIRDGWIPKDQPEAAVYDFFHKWKSQPAREDLPDVPEYVRGDATLLRSAVLGTRILVRAANNAVSIQLAETLLGALEAFLATSQDSNEIFAYREELRIQVAPSDEVRELPTFYFSRETGQDELIIQHRPVAATSIKESLALRDRMMQIIAEIMQRMVIGRQLGKHLEKLARDEGAFTRSLAFSEITIAVENILGGQPKLRLIDWENEQPVSEYPVLRTERWDAKDAKKATAEARGSIWSKLGSGPPPKELVQANLKHGERRIASLIDIPLWNRAGWNAALFAQMSEPYSPPYLALAYRDATAGKQIFEGLRARIGQIDKDEILRVAIITGIDRKYPLDYTVHISRNVSEEMLEQKTQFLMVSRLCRMHPTEDSNLKGFLNRFERTQSFLLAPAHFDRSSAPQLFFDLAISKRELIVRPAWEIADNDPDLMALDREAMPIIPEDKKKDAPVLAALKRIRDG